MDNWSMVPWSDHHNPLAESIQRKCEDMLRAYEANPNLIAEHYGIERQVLEGGYGHRQLFELIQNAADAISEGREGGRIAVVLSESKLYCANTGSAIDEAGVVAILHSHLSRKAGDNIGRFGQGFKSVLQVTDAPYFLSRPCSFGFSSSATQDRIRDRTGYRGDCPTLRLAHPLDPNVVFAADPIAADLATWATTIVVLPLATGALDRVRRDIEQFPAPFLLFCHGVTALTLTDLDIEHERQLTLEWRDGVAYLCENGAEEGWHLFSRDVPVSNLTGAEQQDAGSILQGRECVPLLWAVPLVPSRDRGELWAFAPTATGTTLAGILNAPWKTNNDRQNLLDGPFNRCLLEQAAALIVESLPRLMTEEEPARLLDALPARDAAGWADGLLASRLFAILAAAPCIPTADGFLARPRELRLVPKEAPAAAFNDWLTHCTSPSSWAHPSASARGRYARAQRLGCATATVAEWLLTFVERPSAPASAAAVRTAALLEADLSALLWADVRHRSILLLANGSLAPLDPARVALSGMPPPGVGVAHPELVRDPGIRRFLEHLGLRDEDPEHWIDLFLRNLEGERPQDWDSFWGQVRRLDPKSAPQILQPPFDRGKLRVRSLAGTFAAPGSLYLGAVNPLVLTTSERAAFADAEYHAQHLDLLKHLGMSDGPKLLHGIGHEPWLEDYRHEILELYQSQLPAGCRTPQRSKLYIDTPWSLAPLAPLGQFSPPNQAAFVSRYLEAFSELSPARVSHLTIRTYPITEALHPVLWFVRRNLALPTSLGPVLARRAVGPQLSAWRQVLPVLDCEERLAASLGLPCDLSELSADAWNHSMSAALNCGDVQVAGAWYAEAAKRCHEVPDLLLCSSAGQLVKVAPSPAVTVTCQPDHVLDSTAVLLHAPDAAAAQAIAQFWGLRLRDSSPRPRYTPSDESTQLVEHFPHLAHRLSPGQGAVRLQPCSELEVFTDTGDLQPSGSGVELSEGQILYLEEVSADRLETRVRELLALEGPAGRPEVEDPARADRGAEILERVGNAPSLAEKLVALVGEDQLRQVLPAHVRSALGDLLGEPPNGLDLAKATLALYGDSTLRQLRHCLAFRGLSPPSHWAGGRTALSFVRQLGFPDSFAGLERVQRRGYEEVAGPTELPPLHDFQQAIVSRLTQHLRESKPGRGLLCLPTGAGKTRVTIEATVESLRQAEDHRPILWVAQTDELCEQAVQCWIEVWRAIGPSNRLRVERFWGAQQPALTVAPRQTFQVVVATYQTLRNRLADSHLAWLRSPQAIILDEAHHAIAPSYTHILELLGLSRAETPRPLIGLSATPFRGENEEETRRLVARFGSWRFDHGVFDGDDAYSALQDQGVLARVEQDLLPGEDLRLAIEELAHLERYFVLPPSAEDRLGKVVERNRRILSAIEDLPSDWPALVFATSVGHAELLAGLLAIRGVTAQAISGNSDFALRRRAIERFRQGEIRVLTNYGVLTTGFDAPALRVILVARPVYSRGLYQQMIGRGLRGPKNRGKERCLIINVADNIENFGEQLAFRHFEHLWAGNRSRPCT